VDRWGQEAVIPALVIAAALAGAPLQLPGMGPASQALISHMQKGMSQTKVGDWVTYELNRGDGHPYYWRLAVVGEEKDEKGRDAFWVEIDTGDHHALKAPLSQMRFLVAKSTGLSDEGITRMMVTFGYEKPQELDAKALEFMKNDRGVPDEPGPTPTAADVKAAQFSVRTGSESQLMTAAGTVRAVPVEMKLKNTVLKRIWMSAQIPVLHVAKVEIPAIGHSMEVRDFGGAASGRMVLPGPGDQKIRLESYDTLRPGQRSPDGAKEQTP
jgi:hypothetical protein